jgi:hypothetical protein
MRRLAILLACSGTPAFAIDQVSLEAQSVEVAGARVAGLRATLDIADARHSSAQVAAAELVLPPTLQGLQARIGALRDLRVRCTDPVVREPRFACPALQVEVKSARLGALSLATRLEYASDRGALQFAGNGPTLAGVRPRWDGRYDPRAWALSATLPPVTIAALRRFAQPWLAGSPLLHSVDALHLAGDAALSASVQGRTGGAASAQASVQLAGVALQNDAATFIAEKLAAQLDVRASGDVAALSLVPGSPARLSASVRLRGTAGQLLAGPVLLDFNANALDLEATGTLAGAALTLPTIAFTQRALARGSGRASLTLAPALALRDASVTLEELQFPAAYSSYLQLPLATTDFGSLATTGNARGMLEIRDNAPQRADFELQDITLRDPAKRIAVLGLAGHLRWWSGTQVGPPAPSYLEWREAGLFGIEGGAARLDFLAHDFDFEFLKPARLPIFDGAVLVQKLVARGIGSDALQGAFEAQIEPISMARICAAFGWPQLQGQISGRVPGLEYRDKLLTLGGNLEAKVFDGSIVASRLRVRDPLGPWPRMYGDIVARNLDLNLITSAFEFGSITGRLDADVIDLQTFNWSPVAFDARLATPANDRSAHRISQKAVTNLSNIGGGGGGVAAALQGGLLKFFDTFRYDRIGLTCKLQKDVCIMGGVAPAKAGYYIVKGSGIPRIDIIGNANRVDWPTLMAQLIAGMNTENIVVK